MIDQPEFSIAGRKIGPEYPPYIIAELSANHQQEYAKALEILEMSAEQGADAVKLQTYRPDTITIDHNGPEFRIEGGLWDGMTLYQLYESAHMPWDWHEPLIRRGAELGVHVFSSPFDTTAIDLLASLNTPAYKIASFEATDHALIRYAAARERPLIISTGMANFVEINEAYQVAKSGGASGVALLHCVSGYPTPASDCNLRTIVDLADRFPGVVIGLSDHTLGTSVATAAIALGAAIIEKHVTMSRKDGGLDSAFSLEPAELGRLVRDCRDGWSALGKVHYDIKESERGNLVFRRSLYAVQAIAAGEKFSETNVRSIRPGYGLLPKFLPKVLGQRATRSIERGEPIDETLIVGGLAK